MTPVADGHLATSVLTAASAFDELHDEWDRLLEASDQHGFFLRSRWNQLWWKYYAPPNARLHLIACRDANGTLVGLAPLYSRRLTTLGLSCGREILFLGMGVDVKTSEPLDVIARRGAEHRVGGAVGRYLSDNDAWDRLWLWQVPVDSVVLPHVVSHFGRASSVAHCDRAPYIDTSTDWATFKAGFGRSMRRNVEYYARRLFKTYPGCQFARVRTRSALTPALDALVQLHRARWRAR